MIIILNNQGNPSPLLLPQGRSLMLSYFLSDKTGHFILEPGPDGSFAYVVVSSNQLDRELVNNYTIRVSGSVFRFTKPTNKLALVPRFV